MAMGEAAGVAAAMALDSGVSVRDVDVKLLQQKLRAQGADPGDQSGPNPDLPSIVRQDHRSGVDRVSAPGRPRAANTGARSAKVIL